MVTCKVDMIFVSMMLLSNFMFSVGVIFTNKILYASYNVPPISLASAHFAATFYGLLLYWMCGGFKVKSIPVLKVLPICIAFCSFVVYTNFSLKYNSVGTYQMLKCLGDPMLIIFQTLFYHKTYSTKIKLTLALVAGRLLFPFFLIISSLLRKYTSSKSLCGIMVSGIILNSMFDVTFSMIGLFYALVAVVGSTFYFMWIGAKQEEFEVSPLQLLFYQAPISSIMLAVVALFLEPPWCPGSFFSALDKCASLILISMVMACGINITVFYIIRHTSVVTYAVFSKLKTCVVILVGSALFSQSSQRPLQIVGILLTLFGTFIYTAIKLSDTNPAQIAPVQSRPTSPSVAADDDQKFKQDVEKSFVTLIGGKTPIENNKQ